MPIFPSRSLYRPIPLMFHRCQLKLLYFALIYPIRTQSCKYRSLILIKILFIYHCLFCKKFCQWRCVVRDVFFSFMHRLTTNIVVEVVSYCVFWCSVLPERDLKFTLNVSMCFEMYIVTRHWTAGSDWMGSLACLQVLIDKESKDCLGSLK